MESVNEIQQQLASEILGCRDGDGCWKLERKASRLAVPFPAGKYGNAFVTRRAREVMDSVNLNASHGSF